MECAQAAANQVIFVALVGIAILRMKVIPA
jgi:hypothetical protein